MTRSGASLNYTIFATTGDNGPAFTGIRYQLNWFAPSLATNQLLTLSNSDAVPNSMQAFENADTPNEANVLGFRYTGNSAVSGVTFYRSGTFTAGSVSSDTLTASIIPATPIPALGRRTKAAAIAEPFKGLIAMVFLWRGRALTHGEMLEVDTNTQGLFLAPSYRRWVLLPGATIFNDSLTLPATPGLAPSGRLVMNPAASFGIAAAVSDSTVATLLASLVLSEIASLSPSGGLLQTGSVTLSGVAGLSATAQAQLVAALSVAQTLGMSPAATAQLVGALPLAATTNLSLLGFVVMGVAASLGVTAGQSQSGGFLATGSVTFSVAAVQQHTVQSLLNAALSLGLTDSLSAAARADLGASLALSLTDAIAAQAQHVFQAALTLGQTAAQAQATAQQFASAVTLALAATLTGSIPSTALLGDVLVATVTALLQTRTVDFLGKSRTVDHL